MADSEPARHTTIVVLHKPPTLSPASMTAAVAAPRESPDWASQMTAWSTFALAVLTLFLCVGIGFAAAQFFLTRKFNRTVETSDILKELSNSDVWTVRSRLEYYDDISENRERANLLYAGVERLKKRRAFRSLGVKVSDFIEESARLTERIEIYIRKGVADEGIVVEHVGYDILALYCYLLDVLQERAQEDDSNYEGFRDLALRIQDYAKLHPDDADMRDDLIWEPLPPISYKRGDESEGYIPRWALVRKARLALAAWRHSRESEDESEQSSKDKSEP